MSDEYTPTTEDIGRVYAQETNDDAGFDRWLRDHDAKVAADVVEAAEQANVMDFKPHWSSNEHDQEILAFGTFLLDAARAAALRVGANPTENEHGR